MDRALVIVDGEESTKRLVREAGGLARGVGASLILLHVTSEEQYADREQALADIAGYDASYGVSQAKKGARQFAQNVGNEVFAETDIEFTAAGRLGDELEQVMAVAEAHDCDHIFVRGVERSPSGKALFGDLAQQIALNFDGPVTLLTA
jgi:nucleotide-binding universal stress UspA family protein